MIDAKETIQSVVGGYFDALSKGPKAAVAFFGEPAFVSFPNQIMALNTRSDIDAFIERLLSGLAAMDYSHSVMSDPRVSLLSDTAALFSAIATRVKKDGSELQKTGFTYLLRKGDAGWKIHVIMATDPDKLVSAN